nr:MAG TPA: hypothetical protein [Caudoviricetes sp.]
MFISPAPPKRDISLFDYLYSTKKRLFCQSHKITFFKNCFLSCSRS